MLARPHMISRINVRRFWYIVAFLGPAVGLVVLSYATNSIYTVILVLTIGKNINQAWYWSRHCSCLLERLKGLIFWFCDRSMLEEGRKRVMGNHVGINCILMILQWFQIWRFFPQWRKNTGHNEHCWHCACTLRHSHGHLQWLQLLRRLLRATCHHLLYQGWSHKPCQLEKPLLSQVFVLQIVQLSCAWPFVTIDSAGLYCVAVASFCVFGRAEQINIGITETTGTGEEVDGEVVRPLQRDLDVVAL